MASPHAGGRGNRNEMTFKEHSVSNNKDPNQKQPGEKEPGTFHYNPGNMSGKTIGTNKDQSERSNAETPHEKDKKQKTAVTDELDDGAGARSAASS
jgi:hypothetical protein